MSIYKVTIVHAWANEFGRSTGGQPGNQGDELKFQTWYSSGDGWDAVLRAKDKSKRKLIADCAEKCVRNIKIGYDQEDRYSLYDAIQLEDFNPDKLKIKVNCDCSSLCTVCANYSGYYILRGTFTGNMIPRYKEAGFKILSSSKYTAHTEKLKVGDILVREYGHAAIVVNTIYALLNNQSMTRYTTRATRSIQSRLNDLENAKLKVDGIFGAKTALAVKAFQEKNDLEVDGIVGPQTAKALGMIYL